MSIAFNQIPRDIRVPGTYTEIDSSRNQTGLSQLQRILVIGQRLPSGTIPEGMPVLVTQKSQAVSFFGRGSMLANMFQALFDNNQHTEKWCVALDDNKEGIQASGNITVTGTATASGTINLYLGGILVQASVASGDTETIIAEAINKAINANLDLIVTSTASANIVTVTFRHKGLMGNYFDMRLNYRGINNGESTPDGIKIAFMQLTGGTANPDIDIAIAALPEEIYGYWLVPYRDATTLDKLDRELDSRNGAIRQLEGYAFTAAGDTVSNLATLGKSRNKQFVSLMDAGFNKPSPSYLFASRLVGQVAYAASIDPARPFNTLPLVGDLAEPPEDRRTLVERNTLLYSGISTHRVATDGTVQIERVISTYQKNGSGQPDTSYLDANVSLTLSYLRQSWKNRVTHKFSHHKLANDGMRLGAGQAIITPSVLKGEAIAWYGEHIELGLVDDMDTFKVETYFERDKIDRTRINCMLAVTLIGQFHILATQIAFKL